jgi:hypothetical protein
MGVIGSYMVSSLNDAALPSLRGPVVSIFERVMVERGLPSREDFRELRNRVDMLDYKARECTRALHELRAQLKKVS